MSASRFIAHLINQRVVSMPLPVKYVHLCLFSAYLSPVVSCLVLLRWQVITRHHNRYVDGVQQLLIY